MKKHYAFTIKYKTWVIAAVITLVLGLIGKATYLRFDKGLGWAAWTGFGAAITPDGTYYPAKTLWDLLELLIIPLALGAGAWWLEASEHKIDRQLAQERAQTDHEIAEKRAQTDREIALDHQRQVTLEAYYDRMTNLLLEKDLRKSPSGDEVRSIARARTLAVLRALDGARRGQVVQFLYESGLINANNSIIDLSDADLCNAYLTKANLEGSNLSGTNLHRTSLHAAHLEGSNLQAAELCQAELPRAYLQNSNLQGSLCWWANLCDANLQGAKLEGAKLWSTYLQDANLQDADLQDCGLQDANLQGANLEGANVQNTHYNSGTIWPTDFDPQAAGAILIEIEDEVDKE